MKIVPGKINFGKTSFFETVEEKNDEEKTEVECKVISSKKLDSMTLNYRQIVTILEALYNFKNVISEFEANDGQRKAFIDSKTNEIDKLFSYLENGINYDFEKAVNKCSNRRKKSEEDDAAGMETMSWLSN